MTQTSTKTLPNLHAEWTADGKAFHKDFPVKPDMFIQVDNNSQLWFPEENNQNISLEEGWKPHPDDQLAWEIPDGTSFTLESSATRKPRWLKPPFVVAHSDGTLESQRLDPDFERICYFMPPALSMSREEKEKDGGDDKQTEIETKTGTETGTEPGTEPGTEIERTAKSRRDGSCHGLLGSLKR
jgi:hypothetical protein